MSNFLVVNFANSGDVTNFAYNEEHQIKIIMLWRITWNCLLCTLSMPVFDMAAKFKYITIGFPFLNGNYTKYKNHSSNMITCHFL